MKNLQGGGSAAACEDSREPKLCREASRGLGNGHHDMMVMMIIMTLMIKAIISSTSRGI